MKKYNLNNGNDHTVSFDFLSESKNKGIKNKTGAWDDSFSDPIADEEIAKLKELLSKHSPPRIVKTNNKNSPSLYVQKKSKLAENLQLSGLILLLIITLSMVVLILINKFQGHESYVSQKMTIGKIENSHY